ncbi:hypothetical protein DASC09_058900 [Saccharomycopsis crataegensis]|uniref:ATPase expression protein 2, mitochondrial n=1 Tax=Saccharomycopsis crataegensis TaxID=43959 RepID=A0AAV5QVK2_9ASCO|nr:hypothetical protein DASC09_058900 [Saccharomycopsis crataegensis]
MRSSIRIGLLRSMLESEWKRSVSVSWKQRRWVNPARYHSTSANEGTNNHQRVVDLIKKLQSYGASKDSNITHALNACGDLKLQKDHNEEMENLQDLLMSIVAKEKSLDKESILAKLTVLYGNSHNRCSKIIYLNVLIRCNLYFHRLHEAYTLTLGNLQQETKPPMISNGTLELMIANLLQQEYIDPAFKIAFDGSDHKLTSRIWNLMLFKGLSAGDINTRGLTWLWNQRIVKQSVTYLSNGSISRLADVFSTCPSSYSGKVYSVKSHFLKKNNLKMKNVFKSLLISYYNSFTDFKSSFVRIYETWSMKVKAIEYQDVNSPNNRYLPSMYGIWDFGLKASDFPQITESMRKYNSLDDFDKIFNVSSTTAYHDTEAPSLMGIARDLHQKSNEIPFLESSFPSLSTLLYNIYLSHVVDKKLEMRNLSRESFSILKLIDITGKATQRYRFTLNHESFTYLFKAALIDDGTDSLMYVLQFWKNYKQEMDKIHLSPVIANSILERIFQNGKLAENTAVYYQMIIEDLKRNGYEVTESFLNVLRSSLQR